MGVQNAQVDPTEVGVMRTVMRIAAAMAIAAAVPVAGVSSAVAVSSADVVVPHPYAAVERVMDSTGTVKWFNEEKGFGFITPDGGGPDVYVNYLSIGGGYKSLEPGQRVEFQVAQGQHGSQATDVRPIDQ